MKTTKGLFFIALLAFPLLWSGCDDGLLDYTLVKGVVRDAGSGTPLANAKVVLYENADYFGPNSGLSWDIDTFITDETGRYSFQYVQEPGSIYEVGATKEGYYEAYPGGGFLPNKENTADVHLYAKAWIRIHVKNVNPFDGNDLLTAYTAPIEGSSPQNSYGTNVDFVVTHEVKGNKNKNLTWWVTKNNVYTQYWDTIYCEGHKVTDYELFY